MKLEAGMYVRTKEGIIGKYNVIKEFENVPTFNGFYETKETEREYIDDKPFRNYDIKKASFNLIDLIEVGDYVNGKLVCNVGKENKYIYLIDFPDLINIKVNDDIKSILTHESFESNAYTIEKERQNDRFKTR